MFFSKNQGDEINCEDSHGAGFIAQKWLKIKLLTGNAPIMKCKQLFFIGFSTCCA